MAKITQIMSTAIIETVSVAGVTSVPLIQRLILFLNKKKGVGVDASEPGDYVVLTVATTLYVPCSVMPRLQLGLLVSTPVGVA